jgi:hypothetical protein
MRRRTTPVKNTAQYQASDIAVSLRTREWFVTNATGLGVFGPPLRRGSIAHLNKK